MKIKWRNKALWTVVGTLAVMLVTDLSNVAAEDAQSYVNVGIALLGAAGVFKVEKKENGGE
jgi:hypothetical protein